MAIVETFFRNSNFVVLCLLLLLLLSQLFANLSETQPNPFRIYQKPNKTTENLSDTYHDPSYKVPKNYYWNADHPYFFLKKYFI